MKAKTTIAGLLLLSMAAVPTMAQTATYSCTTDLGAPIVSVERPDGPAGMDAVGGCTLVQGVTETLVVSVDPGDSPITPFQDCSVEYDENGDGATEGTVDEDTDSIPAGSDVLALCHFGFELESSITLG